MILIVGGAASGKRAFAEQKFPGMTIKDSFHEVIRRCLKEHKDPFAEAELLVKEGELAVLFDEVGCGVVPVDPFERQYRESVGRVGCYLAEQAEEVWRVVLGIGTRIK